jgi:membrane-bound lytic murein transglycosylase A
LAAYRTFVRSCGPVVAKAASHGEKAGIAPGLVAVCAEVAESGGAVATRGAARAFFESRFTPHRVAHNGAPGLLTAYYEPILEGSRERGGAYTVPLYRRPPELVNLVEEAQRGAVGSAFTHARKTESGTEPYFTREEIENGALEGRGLELLWLTDPVDTFTLHIQGSGLVRLPDGSMTRITYDGKNGYPYSSVGRYLIDSGEVAAGEMTLDVMKDWLRRNGTRGRAAMHHNKSFIFFRELDGPEAECAMGVMSIPLTEGRSLALDTAYHDIGSPVWVSAPELTHATGPGGFHRLMIAQDVGSAIKGPERGDLYFGTGGEAGRMASITKHPGNFFVLLANAPSVAGTPAAGPMRKAGP